MQKKKKKKMQRKWKIKSEKGEGNVETADGTGLTFITTVPEAAARPTRRMSAHD